MYRNLIHYLKRIVQPVIVWSQRSIAYFKNKSGLNENLSKLFLIGDGTGLVGLMWRRTERNRPNAEGFHKTEYGEGRSIMHSALSLPALEKLLPGFESVTRQI